jgi:hypothetical protein
MSHDSRSPVCQCPKGFTGEVRLGQCPKGFTGDFEMTFDDELHPNEIAKLNLQ